MAELCVNGTAFALPRQDLVALLEAGRLQWDQLRARLPAEDLACFEESPLATSWYPLGTYERLLRILLEVEGGNDPEYLVERGRRGVDAILESGSYRSLRRLEAPEPDGGGDWFERSGHALVTLPSAIFSEGSWRLIQADAPDLFTLTGDGLGAFPMNVARIVEGGIAHLASRLAGLEVAVGSRQPGEGRIVFVGRPAPAG